MNEALIGLLGVLFGIVVTIVLRWLDRSDRFRDLTFEKRLAAHQEAYCLNQNLYEALNSGNKDEIRGKANAIKEWWKKNSLYLDDNSTQSMLALFSSALQYCIHPDHPGGLQPTWELLDANLKDISRGIGSKHLPRIKTEETPNGSTADQSKRGFVKWMKNNWPSMLFIITFVTAVFYLVYISFQVPLSTSYTITTRYKYIVYSLSSVAAFIAAILGTKNKSVFLAVIIAVDLCLLGMIFEVLGFIIASH